MDNRIFFSSITLNNGEKIDIAKNEIIIFVGSNNVGKSVALKNIYNSKKPADFIPTSFEVINSTTIQTEGDPDELRDFLLANYPDKKKIPGTILLGGNDKTIEKLMDDWKTKDIYWLSRVFLKFLTTDQRITYSNSVESLDFENYTPKHPLHWLYLDDQIEELVNKYFRQAFNCDVIVNRFGGNRIHLHVGNKPIVEAGEDRASTSYINKIRSMPPLSSQGDGMRSFVSIILEIASNDPSVLFIDEPESFLHPPQSRLLGKIIGILPTNRQMFIATHNSDFIKGVLDSNNENVKLIRITRDKVHNIPNVLNNKGIDLVWKDPILRHSPVIDGLFHKNVFVCESEGDCKFYSALMNAVFETDSRFPEISDSLFIASHGKAKIPQVVNALKILGVPIYTITDFDVFNDTIPLKPITESHKGNWADIEPKWKLFKTEIEQQKNQLNRQETLDALTKEIQKNKSPNLTSKEIDNLKDILKSSSPWSFAKANGLQFVPKGNAYNACLEVMDYLGEIGVFPLPIGELESFDKSIGGNKSKWIEEVLQKDLRTDSQLKEAREFISHIVEKVFPK
jgi:ABC-type ATPase involved in cell division